MLTKKITEEEIEFMESWHTPRCVLESLFPNFDNLTEYNETNFGQIRTYQEPFYSQESIIDFETTAKYHKLSKKEEFQLRKNVGDIYNLGGRKYGKTLVTEKLDIPLSILHDDNTPTCCSSIDDIHLSEVLRPVKNAFKYHPILNQWHSISSERPKWNFEAKNGWTLAGVNMNLKSTDPGRQYFGKHVKKLWMEECSFETQAVADKRRDALSELGAIFRFAGMTNFNRHSPIGKIFTNKANKVFIINYPQYVNPFWNEAEKEERAKDFGGKETLNYRIYVGGEVVEDSTSEFDMERVARCYLEKEDIKHFEIKKDQFKYFREFIVVERPTNADRIFIDADIGDGSGGSDIIILAEIGEKYKYLYNISLYNLIHDEQLEIFKYIIDKMEANVIGIDCGESLGRTLCDDFEKAYDKENIVRYDGKIKVVTGFELDAKGQVVYDKQKPKVKEEFMSEWSVDRLKHLLYRTLMIIPKDYKFELQFASVISALSGTRKLYGSVSGQPKDHLFSAFRVFAISQWLKSDFNKTPKVKTEWGIGASSWDIKKKTNNNETPIQ